MKPSRLACILALCLTTFVHAQVSRRNVASYLGFEDGSPDFPPPGWTASPARTDGTTIIIGTDATVAHTGSKSARIHRYANTVGSFHQLMLNFPMDFGGSTIELRAYIKTQDVVGAAAIWMREDDASGRNNLAFASTQSAAFSGTHDWTLQSISIPVYRAGATLYIGFLLAGTGTAWADDFQILVDGQPVANAPNAPPSVYTTDTEFDSGSKVGAPNPLTNLSNTQVKNLARLAKVWGFLKYHHPSVVAGERHWDYELFRVMPGVLSASSSAAANDAMFTWVAKLGSVRQCSPCASLDNPSVALPPALEWISDDTLGSQLAQLLRDVYKNRSANPAQFYLMLNADTGVPMFLESSYSLIGLPDSGYQLLGLFRTWNAVQYFYPYRDQLGGDAGQAQQYWDSALEQAIPKVAAAGDLVAYQREMTRFMAGLNDTVSNMANANQYRPPYDTCELPVHLRWVEGKAVVGGFTSNDDQRTSIAQFRVGDAIEQLNGRPVADIIAEYRPYYGDSNGSSQMRDIMRALVRGACETIPVVVTRGGSPVTLSVARSISSRMNLGAVANAHDKFGDAFQKLSGDVAYIKLIGNDPRIGATGLFPMRSTDVPTYIANAAGTKGLIIDLRNGNTPTDYLGFPLSGAIASSPVDYGRFRMGDPTNPGSFRWAGTGTLTPTPSSHYSGKVVLLVDELTQGMNEYAGMVIRAVPGVVVVGTQTAGSGDFWTSTVPLPAAINSTLSTTGLYYANGRSFLKTGIVPDYPVAPTVAGIAAGKDEQLDEAVRLITSGSLDRPKITLAANAENEGAPISPNTWVVIKGLNLAPDGHTRIWAGSDIVNGMMPTQLDGVSVTINGKSAFVYYISPTQVNVLAPTDAIDGQVQVVVTNNSVASDPYTLPSQSLSPSLFYLNTRYVLAQNFELLPDNTAKWTLVGPAYMSVPGYPFEPAKPGRTVVLYGNGFGPTSSAVVNGSAAQSGELNPRPTVAIGGVDAPVSGAVLVSPGLYQINVTVPAIADGEYPIVATYKGASTQPGLMITVKN